MAGQKRRHFGPRQRAAENWEGKEGSEESDSDESRRIESFPGKIIESTKPDEIYYDPDTPSSLKELVFWPGARR
jgi:hypothetical protein